MRILFITEDVQPTYGYGTYSHGLVQALEAAGHDVRCVVQNVVPDFPTIQIPGLVSPQRHLRSPLATYRTARLIDRVANEWHPDVIHFAVETYASALVFMSTTTPSVMTAHGTYSYIPHLLDTPLQRAWSRFATRRAYTRLAHIYAVSTYTKKHLLRFAGWTNQALDDRIHIIPNGVSVVAPLSRIPHDPHEIILVGGVKRRKGALEAIDAVHAYAQKYGERVALRIIGFFEESAPYVKTVRDRIQKYQCEATITLDGELSAEQLVEQYRKTDALIMLSVSSDQYFEGFGLVFLEANAYGVPVVGARGSGAEDAIRTNESGILISQATASEEAADALHTLFSDAVRFEHGAREWAAVHDWSRIGARYIKCYDEVIKSHE